MTDSAAFVAVDPTNEFVIVSIRGSNSIRNYLEDLTFFLVPCTFGFGCLAHGGFLNDWASIKEATMAAAVAALADNPGYKLITTGHSLGGEFRS